MITRRLGGNRRRRNYRKGKGGQLETLRSVKSDSESLRSLKWKWKRFGSADRRNGVDKRHSLKGEKEKSQLKERRGLKGAPGRTERQKGGGEKKDQKKKGTDREYFSSLLEEGWDGHVRRKTSRAQEGGRAGTSSQVGTEVIKKSRGSFTGRGPSRPPKYCCD